MSCGCTVLKNEGASTLRYLSSKCGVLTSTVVEQVKKCAKKVRLSKYVIYYITRKLNVRDPLISALLSNVRYLINLASIHDSVPLYKVYGNLLYPREMVVLLRRFVTDGILDLRPFRGKSETEMLKTLIFTHSSKAKSEIETVETTEKNTSTTEVETKPSMDKLINELLETLCNTDEDELKKYGVRGYMMLSILKSIFCRKAEEIEEKVPGKTIGILDYLNKYGTTTVKHLANTFNISEDDVVAQLVGVYYRDVGGVMFISTTPDVSVLDQNDPTIQGLLQMLCYLKEKYSGRKITQNKLTEVAKYYLPHLDNSVLISLAYEIYRNMTDRDKYGHRKFRPVEDCTKALIDFLNSYQPKKIDRMPYIVFSVSGKTGELIYDGNAKVKIYGDKESGAVTRVEIHLITT